MKNHLVILAASLLLATTAAIAGPSPQDHDHDHDHQGQSDHHDHDRRDHDSRDDHQDRRDDHRDYHDRRDYRDDHRDYQHDRRDYGYDNQRRGYYGNNRGYYVVHDRGPRGGWYRRGGYVPVQYRETRYVINDWRGERLREPPRGYRWIRGDDGQFLLVAIASGVIADILLSH